MKDTPFPTRPPNPGEKLLRDKFYESVVAQDELMGKALSQLLTLELAIPGLYATVLKLIRGDSATVQLTPAFYLTYACWLVALGLTLYALIPKNWKVDPTVLVQDPTHYADGIGIEDFFRQSAQYKRRFLIVSSLLFFIGIFFAGYTI